MLQFTQSICRLLFIAFVLCLYTAQANDTTYTQRQAAYRATALANFNGDAVTIQAYEGVPVDQTALNALISTLPTKSTVDFDIVKLVRILELSNGEYDTAILTPLLALPFWINYGDTLRGYWSENHMIQWMSSDWLLHEKYNKPIDATLRTRLKHYLEVKTQYGYYEFFSSVYAPYSLSGLLNLADFSQDAEIKNLAISAAQRLLKDLLILTNDKGTFFPAAGRNYYGKYETPYGQNHNNLIYLLTGLGQVPGGASHAGGFLATSSLPVDSVIASYTTSLNYIYSIGHTLEEGFVINSVLSPLDRTIAQWSSGAYFHPLVAEETAQLLVDSNMWGHVDFGPFAPLSTLSPQTIGVLSNTLNVASTSSLYCGVDVAVFKHNSITLSSIQDYHKGKVGYQQQNCVANVGTTAVITGAGEVIVPWRDRAETSVCEHLPYVEQHSNVALQMYRPQPVPPLLPFQNPEVALFFQSADYDEVVEDSMWLIGRQQNSYVAIRRHCTDTINGVAGCYMQGGQTWVFVVGDSIMYGSFSNFRNIIHNSTFTSSWYMDNNVSPSQYVYYSKIEVDTVTIEYAWGVDSITVGIIDAANADAKFSVYPNPTTNDVTINLSNFDNEAVSISVNDVFGRLVYRVEEEVVSNKKINTTDWADGIYIVSVKSGDNVYTKKLIKE